MLGTRVLTQHCSITVWLPFIIHQVCGVFVVVVVFLFICLFALWSTQRSCNVVLVIKKLELKDGSLRPYGSYQQASVHAMRGKRGWEVEDSMTLPLEYIRPGREDLEGNYERARRQLSVTKNTVTERELPASPKCWGKVDQRTTRLRRHQPAHWGGTLSSI